MRVEEGLAAGRRWLWDEASRRLAVLLAAPAAFQGEHFLQALPRPLITRERRERTTLLVAVLQFDVTSPTKGAARDCPHGPPIPGPCLI